jgi:dTDP-4-amino-4,6-dideoxygalactose transaminase
MSPTDSIPLARPDLGAREEQLVLEVLRSGRLSLGPMLERFEGSTMPWPSPRVLRGFTSGFGRLAGAPETR